MLFRSIVIKSCIVHARVPRIAAGAISHVYTVTTLKNSPSPAPAIHRPTKIWASFEADATIAEPTANIAAPTVMVYFREIRSERGPAKREKVAAVMRMLETISPCSVGVMGEKRARNWSIVVTGPIEPVKTIKLPSHSFFFLAWSCVNERDVPVSNPKMNPPIDANTVHAV